jgi:alanine dehydrogenase
LLGAGGWPRGSFTRGKVVIVDDGGSGMDRYDLLVIGGGAAGINALKRGLKLGARVALIDSGPLGGTCINRG